MSSKETSKTHTMYSKTDNIEIMISNEADEITQEILNSILQKY